MFAFRVASPAVAVLHRAQVTPSKAELIAGWLPSRSWSGARPAPAELLGAYRFDDPAGRWASRPTWPGRDEPALLAYLRI